MIEELSAEMAFSRASAASHRGFRAISSESEILPYTAERRRFRRSDWASISAMKADVWWRIFDAVVVPVATIAPVTTVVELVEEVKIFPKLWRKQDNDSDCRQEFW